MIPGGIWRPRASSVSEDSSEKRRPCATIYVHVVYVEVVVDLSERITGSDDQANWSGDTVEAILDVRGRLSKDKIRREDTLIQPSKPIGDNVNSETTTGRRYLVHNNWAHATCSCPFYIMLQVIDHIIWHMTRREFRLSGVSIHKSLSSSRHLALGLP